MGMRCTRAHPRYIQLKLRAQRPPRSLLTSFTPPPPMRSLSPRRAPQATPCAPRGKRGVSFLRPCTSLLCYMEKSTRGFLHAIFDPLSFFCSLLALPYLLFEVDFKKFCPDFRIWIRGFRNRKALVSSERIDFDVEERRRGTTPRNDV